MRISTSKNYFYFSFQDKDWDEYGYQNCRQFLNAMEKEFPGGKGGDRFWLARMKAWAIRASKRTEFNRLLKEYLGVELQGEML